MTVTEHIRGHLLRCIATEPIDWRPPALPELPVLRASEWSVEFERGMRCRLIVGAARYGLLGSRKPAYDRLAGIRKRLAQYLETGNAEGPAALEILQRIEDAARVCYASEPKDASPEATAEFVRKLVQVKKHESVIEHVSISVRFTVDRGVSHEIVRHRLAAYSQQSTRYCNFALDRFGNQITVIQPPWADGAQMDAWRTAMEECESAYFALLGAGAPPQMARSVLPNSLATIVVMTANLREWRHVFRLRTAEAAHPQMRQVMCPWGGIESFDRRRSGLCDHCHEQVMADLEGSDLEGDGFEAYGD